MGTKVVIAGRTVERGKAAVEIIESIGGDALFIQTDVSKAMDVERLINKIVEACGRLDYAFNNSGVGPTGARMAKETEENWDHIINTNLKGVDYNESTRNLDYIALRHLNNSQSYFNMLSGKLSGWGETYRSLIAGVN